MKPARSLLDRRVLLLCCLLFANRATAQAGSEASASSELFKELAALDGVVFEAYNACDLEKYKSYLADDVEFYHDKGGLVRTPRNVMKLMADGLCADATTRYRRELVPGSLKVYPLNNYRGTARAGAALPYLYGAVQTGTHLMHLTEKGQKEKPVATAQFTVFWQYKNGKWKMSRILSYDHQDVK
ncbi:uncharacterized protein DUF4440 [Archangium gephyra]|uniref:Uncharacterized protein DUF4440 n=1 Tax=Archangium gephyra TaxID=48 RepID=A0ABX9JTX5_9BACT|nr:nuclear transport factor 2 family protein [Archangium gephyra]REG27024.1 uncharacterized protein DUF4440 [Archangium gephyra]